MCVCGLVCGCVCVCVCVCVTVGWFDRHLIIEAYQRSIGRLRLATPIATRLAITATRDCVLQAQATTSQMRSILFIGIAGSPVVHRHVLQVPNVAQEVCLDPVDIVREIDWLSIGLRHEGADHVGQDDDSGGIRSWPSQRASQTGPLESGCNEVRHEPLTGLALRLVVVIAEQDTNSRPRGGIPHEELGTSGHVCIIVGSDDFLHEGGRGLGTSVGSDGDLDLAGRHIDDEPSNSHGGYGCRSTADKLEHTTRSFD